MLRTLHGYLTKELAKVTALALVAFTLVMTVFAIIEPLRKMGLSADQAISLIGYTLPSMLSLTLPIAALFATTIVYGRFSQDNELLACRASGISSASLVWPALVLGVIATIISLIASNYLTPRMAKMGEEAIRSARGIIYQDLLTTGSYRNGNAIVRAEEIDKDKDILRGVVYADTKENIASVMSMVYLYFTQASDGNTYLTIIPVDPVVMRIRDQQIVREKTQSLEAIPLINPMREKTSFCDWGTLVSMLDQPIGHSKIKKILNDTRLAITHDLFLRDVVAAINSGKGFSISSTSPESNSLAGPAFPGSTTKVSSEYSYLVKARQASIEEKPVKEVKKATGDKSANDDKKVKTRQPTSDDKAIKDGKLGKAILSGPVEVTVSQNGKVVQTVSASSGFVEMRWSPMLGSPMLGVSQASIVLEDDDGVRVTTPPTSGTQPAGTDADSYRRQRWDVGQLRIPPGGSAGINIGLADLYSDVGAFTQNTTIQRSFGKAKTDAVNSLQGDILAEMHSRVAYGVSCFLLVALGAALGLIFRGGQLVSAFALSVIPASVAIVMILMGKELVSNPGVQARFGMVVGLGVIWSGIIALLIANAFIYLKLMRK
jgi:lipopolysaccharide export LptBFGC system permease protein LptF